VNVLAEPTISIGSASPVSEGNTGTTTATVPVTISGASADPVDVHWATGAGGDDAAAAGTDYVAGSGTVHWSPNDAGAQTIQVQVKGDTLHENDEAFTVTLDTPLNTTISGSASSSVTILDDDAAPPITIHGKRQPEGDIGNTAMRFKLTIPTVSGLPVSVDYQTANGTALGGKDFVKRHGTATIAAGKKSTFINVPIKGDTVVETSENFSVGITNPVNTVIQVGAATGVIQNDD
jgi:hypothetical protein